MISRAWTDERVATAVKMWQDGASASLIAGTLGGDISRNAVIGKIHRMGLTAREKGLTQGHRYPPRIKVQPRRPAPQGQSARTENREAGRQRLPSGALPPLEIDATDDLKIPIKQRKTILQLTSKTCRWPVGLPGSVDFFFCGSLPREGKPYCDAHCERAFNRPQWHRMPQSANYNPRSIGR